MTPFSAFQEMLTALSHYQWRIEAALLIVAFDLIVMGAIWVGRRILWRARLCLDRWSAQKYSGRRRGFVPAVAFTAFHILIFIAVLAMLGVPLSVLGALLSAGIALGIFSDAYVGTTFLLRLPYRVGDFIEYREQGIKGLVSAINISTTVLIQADGSNAVIPNRKLADTIVFNYTQYDQHRLCYMLIIDQALPISTIELEIASVVTEIGEQAPYSTPEVRLVSLENRQLRLAIRLRVAVYEQEALAGELIKRLETYCTSKGLTIHRLAPEADSLSGAHP